MYIFFSEYLTDYTTYTFGYTAYCQPSSLEEVPEVYDKGFLPYTGNTTLEKLTFYMARSLRVELENFTDSSENRRVNRKAAELEIELFVTPIEQFNLELPAFVAFCTQYAAERFAGGEMDNERFDYVLSRNLITHIFEFKSQNKVYGYLLTCLHGDMLHYWFSFFDTAYMQSHALGKWMMWKTISWAKENQLKHVYLGTCYQPKSLYKVRDFKGVAFYDGMQWNQDAKLLKYLCKTDNDSKSQDFFKQQTQEAKELYGKLR